MGTRTLAKLATLTTVMLILAGCAITEEEPLTPPPPAPPVAEQYDEEYTVEAVAETITQVYDHLQTINSEGLNDTLKMLTELHPPQNNEYLLSGTVGQYLKDEYRLGDILHNIHLNADANMDYTPLLYLHLVLYKETTLLREYQNPNFTYSVDEGNITLLEDNAGATHVGYLSLLGEDGLVLIVIEQNLELEYVNSKWVIVYDTPTLTEP